MKVTDQGLFRILKQKFGINTKTLLAMSDFEIGQFMQIAQEYLEKGWSPTHTDLLMVDWEEIPVPPVRFFEDPFYAGVYGKTLFPLLKRELVGILSDHRIIEVIASGSLGWGKCVDKSTTCFDYETKSYREVGKLTSIYTETLDLSTGKIVPMRAEARLSGYKECLILRTKPEIPPSSQEVVSPDYLKGHSVTLSLDHPVLTFRNGKPTWIQASQLRPRVRRSAELYSNPKPDYIATTSGIYPNTKLVWEPVYSLTPVGGKEVYDLSVPVTHNFVGNGIVLHNSYILSGGLIYELYRLLCLREPQTYYGLATGTPLVLMNLSVTASNAEGILGSYVRTLAQRSPWFNQRWYKGDTRRREKHPLEFDEKNIFFKVGGSTEFAAIGENLGGGALDEANFMIGVRRSKRAIAAGELDQAQILYDGISRRRQSSSRQFPNDFLERRIEDARQGNDGTVAIMDHATWEPTLSKPDQAVYSKKFFLVFVGNSTTKSYVDIRPPVAEDFNLETNGFGEKNGCKWIKVPVEHRKEFIKDINGALRDLAGLAVLASNPFITDPGSLQDAICVKSLGDIDRKHPYEFETAELVTPHLLRADLIPRIVDREGRVKPILHPDQGRFVHVDLAKNQCACGVVIGHFAGRKSIPVSIIDIIKGPDGLPLSGPHGPLQKRTEYIEQRPIIIFDFKLRYKAPPGGLISPRAVRGLLYSLERVAGWHYEYVTYDGYQSQESIIALRDENYQADWFSIDSNVEAYLELKEAYEDRRASCYEYPPSVEDLTSLEWDAVEGRVRCRPNGSKDVSDCEAGVAYRIREEYGIIRTELVPHRVLPENLPESEFTKFDREVALQDEFDPFKMQS